MRKGGVQLNRERGGRKWDEDGLQTNAVSDDSKCEGGKKKTLRVFLGFLCSKDVHMLSCEKTLGCKP